LGGPFRRRVVRIAFFLTRLSLLLPAPPACCLPCCLPAACLLPACCLLRLLQVQLEEGGKLIPVTIRGLSQHGYLLVSSHCAVAACVRLSA
jgi:hypothetical protein